MNLSGQVKETSATAADGSKNENVAARPQPEPETSEERMLRISDQAKLHDTSTGGNGFRISKSAHLHLTTGEDDQKVSAQSLPAEALKAIGAATDIPIAPAASMPDTKSETSRKRLERPGPDSAKGQAIRQESAESERMQMGYHTFDSLEGVDLPDHVREHNATLSFPEKLMLMLIHIERIYSESGKRPDDAPIAWCLSGKAFVIRNREPLVSHWLPLFFRQAKFSSFTRKLYRWGFRQVNMPQEATGPAVARELFFGNENFQRDSKALLSQMRSITAAGLRRERAVEDTAAGITARASHLASGAEESKFSGFQMGMHQPTFPMLNPSLASLASLPRDLDLSSFGQPNFAQHPLLQQGPTSNPLHHQLAMLQAQALQTQDAQANQYLLTLARLQNQNSSSLLAHFPGSTSQQHQMTGMQLPQSDAERDRLRSIFSLFLRGAAPPPQPP